MKELPAKPKKKLTKDEQAKKDAQKQNPQQSRPAKKKKKR